MFDSKNILMNVTKANEHSNVATFVRVLVYMYCLSPCVWFVYVHVANRGILYQ